MCNLPMGLCNREFFGPVLPFIRFTGHQNVLDTIHSLSHHPLIAYIFSENNVTQNQFIEKI